MSEESRKENLNFVLMINKTIHNIEWEGKPKDQGPFLSATEAHSILNAFKHVVKLLSDKDDVINGCSSISNKRKRVIIEIVHKEYLETMTELEIDQMPNMLNNKDVRIL